MTIFVKKIYIIVYLFLCNCSTMNNNAKYKIECLTRIISKASDGAGRWRGGGIGAVVARGTLHWVIGGDLAVVAGRAGHARGYVRGARHVSVGTCWALDLWAKDG